MLIDFTLNQLNKDFKITKKDIGEFHKIDKSGMHFLIDSFDIKDVGNMSIINMKAMLGLMKMTSIVITPIDKEMPMFSCDLVQVLGNDTALFELNNTSELTPSLPSLLPLKDKYSYLKEYVTEPHWYDSYHLKESIFKKDKGHHEDILSLAKEFMSIYLKELKKASSPIDKKIKLKLTQKYVNTLNEKGGPAVNQFKKMIGEEKTGIFLRKYMFGSEN